MDRRTMVFGAAAAAMVSGSAALFLRGGPAGAAGFAGRNAHDFSFDLNGGGTLSLSSLKGKVVLVVNTASNCSYTRQYGPLQKLYRAYAQRGLVVLAVPSNDFGGQEPGTDSAIADFTAQNFKVTFPITTKTRIRGDRAHPFYQWAGRQVGIAGQPRWNFHKYLIDRNGRIVTWFSTMTSPDSPALRAAIGELLDEPPAMSSSAR